MSLRGLLGLVAAGVLLSGCGPADPSAGPPEPTPSVAATASATPSATVTATATATPARHHRAHSDQHPRPRRGGDFVVTQLSVSVGKQLWAEEVRTCVRRSSGSPHVVGWSDWRAEGVDGQVYPARAGAAHPAYPAHESLAPGQCVTGWWQIPVPAGQAEAIRFAPGGGAALITWPTLL